MMNLLVNNLDGPQWPFVVSLKIFYVFMSSQRNFLYLKFGTQNGRNYLLILKNCMNIIIFNFRIEAKRQKKGGECEGTGMKKNEKSGRNIFFYSLSLTLLFKVKKQFSANNLFLIKIKENGLLRHIGTCASSHFESYNEVCTINGFQVMSFFCILIPR